MVEKESPFFDQKAAYAGFEKNRDKLDDVNGFEWLLNNSRFFNVYNRGYVGSIFVYESEADGRKYLGGWAERKRHKDCVRAVKHLADMFDDVFADTRHLNAVICLQKAGFEWFDRKNKILRRVKNEF